MNRIPLILIIFFTIVLSLTSHGDEEGTFSTDQSALIFSDDEFFKTVRITGDNWNLHMDPVEEGIDK